MSNINNLPKKEILLNKVYRLAFKYEQEHHYCSQCTVAALLEVFQIKSEELFSTSFALGGGLANTCEGTCGALAEKKIFGRSFNFWDEKEKELFEASGGHIDKCPTVVAKTAQWTFKIIKEEINKSKEKRKGYEDKQRTEN